MPRVVTLAGRRTTAKATQLQILQDAFNPSVAATQPSVAAQNADDDDDAPSQHRIGRNNVTLATKTGIATATNNTAISINQEPFGTGCLVCGANDNEDKILLCESCDGEYHTYCIGMDTVPKDDWFCGTLF
jgi:PHD-finger